VLRVRKSGALLVAALIAFVGTLPVAGLHWALTPILLIPLAVLVWAWRAGTDVDAESLRVRALFGTTVVGWSRVAELAPNPRGQVAALLTDGTVVPLTGVTTGNLPVVLEAGGQQLDQPETGGQQSGTSAAGGDQVDRPAAGGQRAGKDGDRSGGVPPAPA
jgi:hypothetical protein